MKVLVTGATGFVGYTLCCSLIVQGHKVHGSIRCDSTLLPLKNNCVCEKTIEYINVGTIGATTNWSEALQDTETVVHLAARVHVMQDKSSNPLAFFREVNTAGTERLARESAKAGVRRFVYLSSIKVNGEETGLQTEDSGLRAEDLGLSRTNAAPSFSETDIPSPQDPYAISKWEAEQALHAISKETGMEVVIIRSPLVYGPGVKANFLKMMQWINRGLPLPLGAINNKRSLVALDNLVDLIITCIDHPAAANQTFLAGDGEDLSTTELLLRIGKALGKPARLLPVPEKLLKIGLNAVCKKDLAQRLCGSLQVDISKARNVLGWEPPLSVDEGLKKTVEWYKNRTKD
ncbi:UDP-glucose 4-epimerase family protein [Thermodesulfobacteriota bacterium]